jgi:tetratricopeptide (TPR) repeat protein
MRFILSAALVLTITAPAAAQSVRVTERLETLQERARIDSNDAAAHYNLAMGYWSKKKFQEAEGSLRTAIAIEPQFADAHLALSIVRNWDEDYWRDLRRRGGDTLIDRVSKERDSHYRHAFLLDPLVDVKILGATYRFPGWGRSHFRNGLEDLVEGRYDRAYQRFSDAVLELWGREPLDSVPEGLLWFRGLAAAHVNQYDQAAVDYGNLLARVSREEATDSTDNVPLEGNDYRYMLAVLNQRMGKMEEAISLYQQVLERDLGNYMAHVQIARIFEGSQQWDYAITERQRAIDTNPDDASLLLDMGITLGRAGQFDKALEVLEQSREMNTRDVRTLFWIGTAAFQLKRHDRAREAFSAFVAGASPRFDRQIAMARQRLTEMP